MTQIIRLPQELIDKIMIYTTFEQAITISDYATKILFDKTTLYKIKKYWCDAAYHGHLETIKWLHKKYIKNITMYMIDAIDYAAENGQLEVVKFLYKNRQKCTQKAITYATKHGHFEVIKYLNKYKTKDRAINAVNNAARFDNLETIKWLHENGT